MLDIECFTYLNALLESPMAPTVIFATNRGHALVRGTTDVYSAHGVPVDLLDRYYPFLSLVSASLRFARCLIVKTEPYDRGQVAKVVNVRAIVEGLKLGPGVLDRFATEGERASLRLVPSYFCIQLVGILILPTSTLDMPSNYSHLHPSWRAFLDERKS